ncbi:MAG: hypothetical protein M3065_01655, partial [Actinomycetota bacterium]|nr:hypothetical protein [Actinomycetota bacterium]
MTVMTEHDEHSTLHHYDANGLLKPIRTLISSRRSGGTWRRSSATWRSSGGYTGRSDAWSSCWSLS